MQTMTDAPSTDVPLSESSKDSSHCFAIVPAAGVGKRMGASIPKQYLLLNNQTVLDATIERLLAHPLVKGVAVVISLDDQWWPTSRFANDERVVTFDGGTERYHSVFNALNALRQNLHPQTRLLVHDAARPCVRHTDISRLIQQAGSSADGAILGCPVRDTMKQIDSRQHIHKTLDRDTMWHAFTPQLFQLSILYDAMHAALRDNQPVTDEASAMELAGFHPLMVEGHADNIKITRPEDLALAAYYLEQQIIADESNQHA